MSPYQSAIYNWVKETGTIRVDPTTHLAGKVFRAYAPLNNKCMELRKVRCLSTASLKLSSRLNYPNLDITPP